MTKKKDPAPEGDVTQTETQVETKAAPKAQPKKPYVWTGIGSASFLVEKKRRVSLTYGTRIELTAAELASIKQVHARYLVPESEFGGRVKVKG